MKPPTLRLRGQAFFLATVLTTAPGCSGIFLKRVPWGPIEPDKPVACTTSLASPVLDIVGSVAFAGLGTVTILGASDSPICTSPGQTDCLASEGERWAYIGVGAFAASVAVLYALSAISGFNATSECARVHELQNACLAGDGSACSRLTGAPPPATSAPPGG